MCCLLCCIIYHKMCIWYPEMKLCIFVAINFSDNIKTCDECLFTYSFPCICIYAKERRYVDIDHEMIYLIA